MMTTAPTARRAALRAAALAMCLVFAAGCAGTSATEPDPAPAPAEDYRFPVDDAGDYTFEWSAADGIDLFSTEATLVRATAEALTLSHSVGTEASFPGFGDSWSDEMNWKSDSWIPAGGYYKKRDFGDPRGRYLRDGDFPSGPPQEYQRFGPERAHLAQVTPIENGFTGSYCIDSLDSAVLSTKGNSWYWSHSLSTVQITMTRELYFDPVIDTPPVMTTEASPYRAPNYNAFAGWQMEKIDEVPPAEIAHLCRQWQRDQHPDIEVPRPEWGIPSRTEPLHRPPAPGRTFPGWPSAPMP